MAEAPINVKLLLIGNSSVGKSSLLLRFSDQQWLPEDEASATIGVDFRVSGVHRLWYLKTLRRGANATSYTYPKENTVSHKVTDSPAL